MTLHRRKQLRRKTSLRPKVANHRKTRPKRKPSEFARIYGSTERVEWIQARPCVSCGRIPSENAHIPSKSGMGRKGDYTNIIPLCTVCHRRLHDWGPAKFSKLGTAHQFGLDLHFVAMRIEALWQDHLAGRAP